jgi:uncharacterized protein YjbI with pentapeptide repeats
MPNPEHVNVAQGGALAILNWKEANNRGLDLSGANLSRLDLRNADLSEANLTGANLEGTQLNHANLYRVRAAGLINVALERTSPPRIFSPAPAAPSGKKLS